MRFVFYLKWGVPSLVSADCSSEMYPEIPLADIDLPTSGIVVVGTAYTIKVPILHNHIYEVPSAT